MADGEISAELITSLTREEIAVVEELGGLPLTQIITKESITFEAMFALAFVVSRRSHPDLTYADTRTMTMQEMFAIIGPRAPTPIKKLQQPAGTTKRRTAASG